MSTTADLVQAALNQKPKQFENALDTILSQKAFDAIEAMRESVTDEDQEELDLDPTDEEIEEALSEDEDDDDMPILEEILNELSLEEMEEFFNELEEDDIDEMLEDLDGELISEDAFNNLESLFGVDEDENV